MADIDPKYEYDAPVYVDFSTVALDQVEPDDADKWFDNRIEDEFEDNFEDSFIPPKTESRPSEKLKSLENFGPAPSTEPTPEETPNVDLPVNSEPEASPAGTVKQQIVDEVEPAAADTAPSEEEESGGSGSVKLGKRPIDKQRNEFLECMAKVKRVSAEEFFAIAGKHVVVKKEPKTTKDKRPVHDTAQKATSNIHQIVKKPRTPRKPVEHTPVAEKTKHHQTQPKKTTEQLQLDEVKRLQKEAKRKLQQSRRSFQRLAKTSAPVVVKGSKPTTQAMEFNFHTKDRERTKPGSAKKQSEGVNTTNYPQTLRNFNSADNYNPNFNIGKKPPTPDYLKVKPFKFCLDERFKSKPTPSSGEVVSVAEAIEKYQKATPPRFRSNPGSVTKKWHVKANLSGQSTVSSSSGNSDDTSSSFGVKLTVPSTPNLRTKGRSRPMTIKSAAEEEEEVVAQMKEYQFKAKPVNKDVFTKGGLHGVPRRKTEVHLTDAHTPPLATKTRSLKRKAEEINYEEEEQTTFHAKPMPNFGKVMGVPAKRLMPITEPESPALALKRRRLNNSQSQDEEQEETDSHVIRANPMPDMEKVFKPQLPHKVVETKPFSFEERDKYKPNRQTLVEMILSKEKKPDFKAKPLPDFGLLPDLPPKAPSHLTEPKPFSLHTEIRGEKHSIKHQEKIDEKTQRIKEEAEFRANPATVLEKEPFVPQKIPRPLLTVDNFVLHSQARSEKRAKYDAKRMKEEYQKMTENLQRRALRAREESKELAEYRKQLVHKAQPIHHYAPVVIKPSERPFTEPKSPHFLTDDRLRSKNAQ